MPLITYLPSSLSLRFPDARCAFLALSATEISQCQLDPRAARAAIASVSNHSEDSRSCQNCPAIGF